jgi:microcystin-dependent protein
MEGMIGEVRMFAGNFAPKNWAFCQAQIIAIASNTALFSILGTTYGGNGTTTFALPDMQGRVCLGAGTGPGLSTYALGQKAGSPNVTLNQNQLAAHTHAANGTLTPFVLGGSGDETNPASEFWAVSPVGDIYASSSGNPMGPSPVTCTLAPTGGNQPHQNEQPYLGMNYVICMYGIFPSRG